jgi:putative membrane-bound dehydrogenase-like protein
MLSASAAAAGAAEKYTLHSFKKLQLSDKFFCEGASFGDFNHDGVMDVVSGPYWYAGPSYTERHEYYAPKPYDIVGYSDNFFTFTHDINRDGWTDIVVIGFPGKEAWWFANPRGKPGNWERHTIMNVVDNESPTFADLTGDGKPELVCSTSGQFGYAEMPRDDPAQLWKFHPITPNRGYQRFTHGMGIGDVNGDHRLDLLEKDGWWEQPAPDSKAEFWEFHPVKFSEGGGAQMYAFDVDGDADNDIVTSKAAHAYGLSWFENLGKEGKQIRFKEHLIMGEKPVENEYGVAFSQLHAVAIADMDHDGIPDIITGKRFWAHAEHDPGSLEPAVSYWFKTVRDGTNVRFIPYLIDRNSGVGTQVVVGDINGDKWDDVVVGNKKGTFVFTHEVEDVNRAKWEAAQPKPVHAAPAKADTPPAAKQDAASSDEGIAATAADGRVLNLDFEKGDLSDWTATGDAFQGQPIEGDTIHTRLIGRKSGDQGRFWIGTGERTGDRDDPQGTLTSVPFKVTHPYARFLVGGGAGGAQGVELVRADTNEVVFKASGRSREELRPIVADLTSLLGKKIFIRVIDHGSAGWGRTNFDDFRFFDERPIIAKAPQTGGEDFYPYAGLPGEEAVKVMKLPDGFSVTLAAAEPDVKQPIAMALDDRGRLWIAEAYEYPVRAPEGKGRDRILIFEDTDGDGKFDSRKVFAENLNLVSGLEVGFGGVFVGAAPYLLFIPDKNGDDIPDRKPEVLLDGWAYQDTHETLNAFIWGPDGWLYGCHGVFTHSRVGKPGTPDSERTPLTAGIWRYHPLTHKFEVFAEGTSNPWGVDFDDHGQAFCTACVIPHLWHMIQGGRYLRQGGTHENPYTYQDIQTIADHLHYVGGNGPHAGNGKSGDAGGGHAHAGAMIYLGGAWPDAYRTTIFMNNIHGQRINTDILEHVGSGFVGHHGKDFLLSFDLASQILNLRYGPDGQVYIIDWYDLNACHHTNVEGHDRTNGRIYKVSYGKPEHKDVDLKKLGDRELAELVLEKNDWYVRHARRILEERAAGGKLDPAVRKRLAEIATTNPDETRRLRAMWTLDVTGGVPAELIQKLLTDTNEYVRGWAIQLSIDHDHAHLAELLPQFAAMAEKDTSPVVRLYLASAMQRVPPAQRWEVVRNLAAHTEDINDHNLPLMYWYAAEPLVEADSHRALSLALSSGKTMPLLRELMLRRIGSLEHSEGLAVLSTALGESGNLEEQLTIVRSLRSALAGQRRATPPAEWAAVYQKLARSDRAELMLEVNAVGVAFGDATAMNTLRALAASSSADEAARRDALKALLDAKDSKLATTLQSLLADPKLREVALSGLASYDDRQTPGKVLAVYSQLSTAEKRLALATLAARTGYGIELLKAVKAESIPSKDLSADLVRQLHNLKDESIDKMIGEVWGQVRSTPADKAALIKQYHDLIEGYHPTITADESLGRAVFGRTCQQCHTLFGVGAKIGPDLTGSNRTDVTYLLTNIVDPSAVMAKEYQPSVITTTDGRVITGIVASKNDSSITVRTATETIVVPKNEIDDLTLSQTSMMPEDQLKQFSQLETLSLFAYLRGKEQVPMLATKENACSIFNGKDLTGWSGDTSLWSVVNGEIVGRTSGLKHNTFLMSDMSAKDFKLSLEVKLVDDEGNSGVQFRTQPLDGFNEVRGYQADIGPGWWGKLYEENGRGLLTKESGEKFLKKGEWNRYEVEAIGGHIRTWLNGQLCVDYEDQAGKRQGVFALQLHAGGKTVVRYRNLQLEVK